MPNFRYKFNARFPYNEVGPAEMHVRSLSIKNCSMRSCARKTASPGASLQSGCNRSRFSILYGAVLFHERVSKRGMAGVFLAIAGSVIIGWGDFQISGAAFWGDVLSFVSAGVISLHFLFGQILRRELDVLPYTAVCYSASTLCLAVYALVTGQPFTGYSLQTWGCFLGLALFATVGGQCVFNLLLKYLPASAVTMGILGEPVGTILLAFIIFGESILPQQGIGMFCILSGLWIFFRRK